MPTQRSRQRSRLARTILSTLTVFIVFYASDALLSRPSITFTRRQHAALSRKQEHTALLMAAKSGGKIITSEEEFEKVALSESLSKPVMVFFTAPWYVKWLASVYCDLRLSLQGVIGAHSRCICWIF